MTIPFTYLIGWSNHNKYYYGARWAEDCHPTDLWTIYFTSSNYVKVFREQFGEPDIIQIRKIFDDPIKASTWETEVLRRMDVISDERFLNKAIGGYIDPEIARKRMTINNPMKNSEISKKVAKKTSKTMKNRMKCMSKEERSKKFGNFGSTNPFYGKQHPPELLMQITDNICKFTYTLIFPDGTIHETHNLNKFCKDYNLNRDILMKYVDKEAVPPPPKKSGETRYNTIGITIKKKFRNQ